MRTGLQALALAALLGLAPMASQAQVSDDVIRIGVMNDPGGPYGDIGGQGSIVAARLAAEDFGGKVLGKRIEIIGADHQNRPDVATTTARRWYDNDRVDVIADGAASSTALAIQEVAREKHRIFLNSGAATSDFTGKYCSPYGFHFTYDTYALANGTGRALTQQGGNTWFFITVDYAFGHALARDTARFVQEGGGRVLGEVRHPLNTADFSSFLLQAQSSKAQVIALANGGQDTVNAVKQAREFGVGGKGQRLAAMLLFLTDIHALGLDAAQGLLFADGFYWDHDDATRAFAARFEAQHKAKPTMVQAGVYSSVLHYLRSVAAAKTDDSKVIAQKMRELPIKDPVMRNASIRPDGRVIHDTYLVQVKTPAESKGAWDYLKVLATIPAQQAFQPLDRSACPLVAKK